VSRATIAKPGLYLAGAIRDNCVEDFQWRVEVEADLSPFYTILDPLYGKANLGNEWTMHGHPSTADVLVPRDLAMIHLAEVLLVNLLALDEDYPCIGTLMELGVALELRKLTVVVGPKRLVNHPFVQRAAYLRVTDLHAAVDWLTAEAQWIGGLFDPARV
jgi:hypothetical protein